MRTQFQQDLYPQHSLARLLFSLFAIELILVLAVQLWKLMIAGHLISAPILAEISHRFGLSQASDTLSYLSEYGLMMHGFLCLFIIGLGKDTSYAPAGMHSFGFIGLIWPFILMLQVYPDHLFAESSIFIPLSNILGVYPSSQGIEDMLTHSGYILLWCIGFMAIIDHRSSGYFYLHADIYSFFMAAYSTYGGFILLSLLTSEAYASVVPADWLAQANWLQTFFLKISVLLSIFAGLHLFGNVHKSARFEGLAFSHLFSLLLGFTLIYVASPYSSLGFHLEESMEKYLLAGLLFIWMSHLFYCYYSSRQIKEGFNLNAMNSLVLFFSLGLVSLGILNEGSALLPAELSHRTSYLSLMSEEVTRLGIVLSIMVFMQLITMRTSSPLSELLKDIRLVLMFFGTFTSGIAMAVSLYFQHTLEVKAETQGIAIDFFEIQANLNPLLVAYSIGLITIILAAVSYVYSILSFTDRPQQMAHPKQPQQSKTPTRPLRKGNDLTPYKPKITAKEALTHDSVN